MTTSSSSSSPSDAVSSGKTSTIRTLSSGADAVSLGNSITDGLDINAIQHALTSAELTFDLGRPLATLLGDLKEDVPALFPSNADDTAFAQDSFKDQFNNEVGRRIADFVRANNLPKSAIDDLIIDAYQRGELIVDERLDPRVEVGSTPEPTWNGPSENWEGSSAGRDFTGQSFIQQNLPPLVEDVVNFVKDVGQAIADIARAIGDFVGGTIDSIGSFFNDFFQGLEDFFSPNGPLSSYFGPESAFFGPDNPFALDGPIFGPDGPILGPNGIFGPNGPLFGEDGLFGPNSSLGGLLDRLGEVFGPLFDILDAFLNPPVSPLVLDLDGDGIELISLENSNAFFDLNEDGFAELTGFVAPDDALLAIDRNGDGIINSNAELFGSTSEDGFFQLSQLDSNQDGIIDAQDDQFSDLVLFQDLNSDGFTDERELISLTEAGIVSISLAAVAISEVNQGHDVLLRSTFEFSDGSTGQIDDVFFQNNRLQSRFNLPDDLVIPSEALLLPSFRGYGTLADAEFAYALNPDLIGEATDLVALAASGNVTEFLARFETFFIQLNGADNVDPASRGGDINGQHLAVLENLYGQPFNNGLGGNDVVTITDARALEEQYEVALETYAARFLVQSIESNELLTGDVSTGPINILRNILFDLNSDRLLGDISALVDTFILPLSSPEAAPVGLFQVIEIFRLLRHDFNNLGVDVNGVISAGLVEAGFSVDQQEFILSQINAPERQLITGSNLGETVFGTQADDIIRGLAGDDLLVGGDGNDQYSFGVGSGNDIIFDDGLPLSFTDSVHLEGLLLSDVTISTSIEDVDDIIITINATQETLLLDDQHNGIGVEQVVFADGTVLNRAQLTSISVLRGTNSSDVITGASERGEIFDGLGGDDTINGGLNGSDTFLFRIGSGDDVILDEGRPFSDDDVLVFDTLQRSDVTIIRNGSSNLDAIFLINSTGETITFVNQFTGSFIGGDGVEFVTFVDGVTLNRFDIQNQSIIVNLGSDGTSASDLVRGDSLGNNIDGREGNDIIFGLNGNDLLDGGDGVDSLIGGSGSDTLDGGSNNDTLDGGDGNDVLMGNGGSDNLTGGSTGADFLDGGSGSDTLSGGSNNDTLLGGVTGADFLDGGSGSDFLDGGSNSDTLIGGTGNDVLLGGDGDDRLEGLAGADNLNGGAGFDIADYRRSGAAINVNLEAGTGSGGDAQGDSLTATERVLGSGFGDVIIGLNDIGTRLQGLDGNDQLSGGNQNDTLEGGNGNDLLDGGNGADSLIGGSGSDTLDGGSNDDTLDGGAGNDVLMGNGGSDNLTGGSTGADFLDGGGGSDTLSGGSNNDTLLGGDTGADVLDGGSGSDFLDGGSNNDTLNGGTGNDVLIGGTGSDVFVFTNGFGQDVIEDFSTSSGSSERIDLSAVSSITSFSDLINNHLSLVDGNAVITDGSNTITLIGVTTGLLNSDDFIF